MEKQDFIRALGALRPSSTFLTLHKYRNNYGEIANYNIIFHISYVNALQKSIEILENIKPATDLSSQAKRELLTSFHTSIQKASEVDEDDDVYHRFFNEEGILIKGIKMHTATSTLHLEGFAHKKTVLTPGIYPEKNQRLLTIEKERLRQLCPISKFRQFRITPGQLEKITVQNLSFLPPT
jgi:Ca2+-dependent lipid-binding protein